VQRSHFICSRSSRPALTRMKPGFRFFVSGGPSALFPRMLKCLQSQHRGGASAETLRLWRGWECHDGKPASCLQESAAGPKKKHAVHLDACREGNKANKDGCVDADETIGICWTREVLDVRIASRDVPLAHLTLVTRRPDPVLASPRRKTS
jgi:hypothetical protein